LAKLKISQAKEIIKAALKEDMGSGDVTSKAVIAERAKAKAKIVSKDFGILAGIDVAKLVFEAVDKRAKVKVRVKDGARVYPGRVLLTISGSARSIMAAERTALNFLQRMSGIATMTKAFVNKVKFSKKKILATRKTSPGLRLLDKYAVVVGGGLSHRKGLYDAVLIKENHIAVAGGVKKAVSLALRNAPPTMGVEVEARTLRDVKEAIEAGANTILLDNMNRVSLRQAVRLVRKHNEGVGMPQAYIQTEASGGITLKNVSRIARTGVDSISVGALTHSPRALDISLVIV
jgi:nicotinate-nucleotide pyrophosphorylase (carboxylating)